MAVTASLLALETTESQRCTAKHFPALQCQCILILLKLNPEFKPSQKSCTVRVMPGALSCTVGSSLWWSYRWSLRGTWNHFTTIGLFGRRTQTAYIMHIWHIYGIYMAYRCISFHRYFSKHDLNRLGARHARSGSLKSHKSRVPVEREQQTCQTLNLWQTKQLLLESSKNIKELSLWSAFQKWGKPRWCSFWWSTIHH